MRSKPDEGTSLVAGPIHVKFADGELRYLTVGDREIVRRVYFSLRDRRWDTTPSEFKRVEIQKKADSFHINLSAVVRTDAVNFQWDAEITGTSAGQITYEVHGQANSDFKYNRFGICVLYGAPSLVGQKFELVDAAGKSTEGEFPRLIRADVWPSRFHTLKYTTGGGMEVATTLAPVPFGMEDQRNWADSSFKAFSGMDFPYPNIVKGAQGNQTLTITVKNAGPQTGAKRPLRIEVGQPVADSKMPKIVPFDDTAQKGFFLDVNKAHDRYQHDTVLSWPYSSAVNLFDDDTQFENLSSIEDQAASARSIAPAARLRITPLTFNPPYPRSGRDPRNQTMFGAAWSAAAVKHMAAAGVDEAMFDVGPGPVDAVLKEMNAHAGSAVLATRMDSASRPPVDAVAVQSKGATVIWVINLTSQEHESVALSIPGVTEATLRSLDPQAQPDTKHTVHLKQGQLPVKLPPYGVYEVTVRSK
jgi:hypothetical protein